MVRKVSLLAVILLFSCMCLWSAPETSGGTVGFVYGNQVSSIDFNVMPRVGMEFRDSENNVLIVSKTNGNVVVFDRISTLSPVREGDILESNGRQHTVFSRVSLSNALVGYGVSTILHPVRPIALAGLTYEGGRVFAAVGLETDVSFSKLWDNSFTFIEDGGVLGWCALGAFMTPSIGFVCSYGLSYRHYIGAFRWELGVSWLKGTGGFLQNQPFLGIGVSL